MIINNFKRISNGKYKDKITGVMIVRECDKDWVICIEDYKHNAFVTLQWGEPLATYKISGFTSMREAKEFDFFNFFHRTGRPYKNKKGEPISVPVTGLGCIPVVSDFPINDLTIHQGRLF